MVRGSRAALAAGIAAVALAVLPASAGAANAMSIYIPDHEARHFGDSHGGWQAESEADGLCIPVVSCPAINNHWVADGGTLGPGDGYLSTGVGDLLGVAGETRAIWTSPAFVYNGAEGQQPTRVTLAIARRSSLGALLSVVGNSATYSVEIVDETALGNAPKPTAPGTALRVIDRASLAPTQGWTRSGSVPIDPGDLALGHTYRIRVITALTYGAEALAGGSADYDEVTLTAVREEGDGGGPGGPGGPDGPGDDDGGGGRGGANGNSAVFDGRNLFIKLRCFGVRNAKGKCITRATILQSKKGKRYTFPIQRVVKAKKGKVVRARVRFQYRKKLERSRSVVLRSVLRKSRKDTHRVIKYKRLKLIRRG